MCEWEEEKRENKNENKDVVMYNSSPVRRKHARTTSVAVRLRCVTMPGLRSIMRLECVV